MKMLVKKGRTSLLVEIFIQDASSTTGAGLTGLTNASSGLVCYRARQDDGNNGGTQLSLGAGTRGTWSSGGFKEKDATNMPGVYELGLDNAGLASGSETVVYMLKGAANMAPVLLEIQLVALDPQDVVRAGLTALPNAAAEAAGGLITRGSGAGQVNQDGNGRIDTNVAALGGSATNLLNLALSASVIYRGTVTGAVTTTTLVDSGLNQSDSDFWKGRVIIPTSGTQKYQGSTITAFNPTTDEITFDLMTTAMQAGDTYVII